MSEQQDDVTRRDDSGSSEPRSAAATVRDGSAHTPGPWRVTTPGAFSNDGMPVAGVWVEAGEYTSVANLIPVRAVKANAHLIAAAPDLLAVVRALLPLAQRIQKACANGDHLDYDNEFDAADAVEYAREIERAEKAIAKAEGRT
jgi:hypothetical protein